MSMFKTLDDFDTLGHEFRRRLVLPEPGAQPEVVSWCEGNNHGVLTTIAALCRFGRIDEHFFLPKCGWVSDGLGWVVDTDQVGFWTSNCK